LTACSGPGSREVTMSTMKIDTFERDDDIWESIEMWSRWACVNDDEAGVVAVLQRRVYRRCRDMKRSMIDNEQRQLVGHWHQAQFEIRR
jgi:hypothetical protein